MVDNFEDPSSESRLMVERAVFGEQVHIFMNTEIGAYLKARSEDLEAEALRKLVSADPEDAKAVRALQNDVLVARATVSWLQAAIADGLRALHVIESRE